MDKDNYGTSKKKENRMKQKTKSLIKFVFVFYFLLIIAVHAQEKQIIFVIDKMKEAYLEINDMKCLFIKRITKQGKEFPETSIIFKFKKNPETTFLEYLNPHKGRKCLFIKGENDNKMIVRPDGFWHFMKIKMNPLDKRAMEEDLDPITKMGFKSIIKVVEEWYQKSLTNPLILVDFKKDFIEDDILAYRLHIKEKNSSNFLLLLINKQTFLPYKFQYNYDSNCAIYIFKNVSKNCNLRDEDFEL